MAKKSKNQIHSFFHCMKCLGEKPEDTSPREWAQLEVGFTSMGVQVWCKRHEMEVAHVRTEKVERGCDGCESGK